MTLPGPYREFLLKYGSGILHGTVTLLPLEKIETEFKACFDNPRLLFSRFLPVGFDKRLQEVLAFVFHENKYSFIHLSHEEILEKCGQDGSARTLDFAQYLEAVNQSMGRVNLDIGSIYNEAEHIDDTFIDDATPLNPDEIIEYFTDIDLFSNIFSQPPFECIHFSDLESLQRTEFQSLPGVQCEDPFDKYQENGLIPVNVPPELKKLRSSVQKIMFKKKWDHDLFRTNNQELHIWVNHILIRTCKDAATEKFLGLSGPWTMACRFLPEGNIALGLKNGQFIVV